MNKNIIDIKNLKKAKKVEYSLQELIRVGSADAEIIKRMSDKIIELKGKTSSH